MREEAYNEFGKYAAPLYCAMVLLRAPLLLLCLSFAGQKKVHSVITLTTLNMGRITGFLR